MRYIHLEVSPAGCLGWLCRLCFTVFCFVLICFYSGFTVTLMHAGLPCVGMLMLASSCTEHFSIPLPCSAQTPLHYALCFRDDCQHFVRNGSQNEGWVNEGQLNLLNFPKEASNRQKLIVFQFLVDLFTSSTLAHELD